MTQTAPRIAPPASAADRPRPGLDLCTLLLVALGVQAIRSSGIFLHDCGLDHASAAVAASIRPLRWIDYTVGTTWLMALLHRRQALRSTWQACRTLAPGAVAVTGTLLPGNAAFVVETTAFLTMLLWLTVEVCQAHAVAVTDILRPKPTGQQRGPQWMHWTTDAFALICAAWLSVLLISVLTLRLQHIAPVLHTAQANALGLQGSALATVTNILGSAALEEGIMVAAVCALGKAAAWPTWLIYGTSVGLRIVCHLYFGVPGVGVLILGLGAVSLYRSGSRLTALLAGHVAFDLFQSFVP